GFSAYTQVPEQKTVIRPFLVWYGDAQRKRTDGTYWRDIIDNKLREGSEDFAIITDVRYAHYPKDEIQWVRDDWNGIVVHVSRFIVENGNKAYILPPNEHEMINDPKMKALSD